MATKQKQGNRFIQNKIEGEAQTFTFDFIGTSLNCLQTENAISSIFFYRIAYNYFL